MVNSAVQVRMTEYKRARCRVTSDSESDFEKALRG
jgi:hypothetical protein